MNRRIQKFLVILIPLIVLLACSPSARTIDSKPKGDVPALTSPTASLTIDQEAPGQDLPACLDVPDALVCVSEIVTSPQDIKVMLELSPDSKLIEPGSLVFALPDLEKEQQIVLVDESGNSLSLNEDASDFLAEFDSERQLYKQTLVFAPVNPGVRELTLRIPLLSLKVPSEETFQVDLGANPQPGQVITLDTRFSIGVHEFHLKQAEFEGDGSNSLRVTLSSEPVDLPDNVASIQPLLGSFEGISVGFGSKTIVDGWPFRAFADLIVQPGRAPISGVINVPVQGMIYNYRGPFDITFQLP